MKIDIDLLGRIIAVLNLKMWHRFQFYKHDFMYVLQKIRIIVMYNIIKSKKLSGSSYLDK